MLSILAVQLFRNHSCLNGSPIPNDFLLDLFKDFHLVQYDQNWDQRISFSSSTMKLNKNVSSSAKKQRKRHFTAPSHIRRKLMTSPLSKDLRQKYGVK